MPRAASRTRRPKRRGLVLAMLGAAVIVLGVWTVYNARQPGAWQHVLATREGMIGDKTSTRMIIRADSMFVALPHPRALRRFVEVRYRDRALVVPVLDVGPGTSMTPTGSTTPGRRPSAGAGSTARRSTPRGSICPTRCSPRSGSPTTPWSTGGSCIAATSRCRTCSVSGRARAAQLACPCHRQPGARIDRGWRSPAAAPAACSRLPLCVNKTPTDAPHGRSS